MHKRSDPAYCMQWKYSKFLINNKLTVLLLGNYSYRLSQSAKRKKNNFAKTMFENVVCLIIQVNCRSRGCVALWFSKEVTHSSQVTHPNKFKPNLSSSS